MISLIGLHPKSFYRYKKRQPASYVLLSYLLCHSCSGSCTEMWQRFSVLLCSRASLAVRLGPCDWGLASEMWGKGCMCLPDLAAKLSASQPVGTVDHPLVFPVLHKQGFTKQPRHVSQLGNLPGECADCTGLCNMSKKQGLVFSHWNFAFIH